MMRLLAILFVLFSALDVSAEYRSRPQIAYTINGINYDASGKMIP